MNGETIRTFRKKSATESIPGLITVLEKHIQVDGTIYLYMHPYICRWLLVTT